MESIKSANILCQRSSPKIAVLGIGNLLLKDEGIGVHVAQKLAAILDENNVKIIDAGTYPDFISLVDDELEKLIVVDAVVNGDKPGTIYRFSFDDEDLEAALPLSAHDIDVLDSLRTMALLDRQPKSTVIIGVEPRTIDFGLELSPQLEETLPKIIDLVLKEIHQTTAMEVDK